MICREEHFSAPGMFSSLKCITKCLKSFLRICFCALFSYLLPYFLLFPTAQLNEPRKLYAQEGQQKCSECISSAVHTEKSSVRVCCLFGGHLIVWGLGFFFCSILGFVIFFKFKQKIVKSDLLSILQGTASTFRQY